ncbi:MAG: hypothetical protein K5653_09210 [Clostridiales bacterium]|nr:hypothetical protein [Clostridiales bacterium]
MKNIITFALLLSLTVSWSSLAYANELLSTEEVTRVREVEELRELNSDTYLLSDGLYECVIYSGNKYYETDNGKLAEIDNSIVSEERTVGDIAYAYANKANDIRIFFADNKPAVYIESAGNYLSFEMEDTQVTNAIPGGDKSMSPVSEFDLQGNNCIIYPDIKPQTDLVYEVRDNVLKEYIIIKGPNASADFTFSFGPDSLLEKINKAM